MVFFVITGIYCRLCHDRLDSVSTDGLMSAETCIRPTIKLEA